jgi:hypothetical protein
MPGALTEILRRTPLSVAKLDFAWRSAVGQAIDRATSIRLGEAATLIVDARDERWRQEIARAERVILERLARLLGPAVVRQLEVRVHTTPQRAFRW